MNLIAWVLALSLLTAAIFGAVMFHEATVCRQKAWLKSTELKTRTLLHRPSDYEQRVDAACKVYVVRKSKTVSWQRLPNYKRHDFKLDLRGKI